MTMIQGATSPVVPNSAMTSNPLGLISAALLNLGTLSSPASTGDGVGKSSTSDAAGKQALDKMIELTVLNLLTDLLGKQGNDTVNQILKKNGDSNVNQASSAVLQQIISTLLQQLVAAQNAAETDGGDAANQLSSAESTPQAQQATNQLANEVQQANPTPQGSSAPSSPSSSGLHGGTSQAPPAPGKSQSNPTAPAWKTDNAGLVTPGGTPVDGIPKQAIHSNVAPLVEQNTGSAPGKQQVVDALGKAGATKGETAMILAMGMQETNDFNPAEGDHTKSGGAANYSAFNLNGDELKKLGYNGDPNALNDPSKTGYVATLLLHGMRTLGANGNSGLDRVMNMTRGGTGNADNENSPDYQQWRAGITDSAQILMNTPGSFTDGTRVAVSEPYWG